MTQSPHIKLKDEVLRFIADRPILRDFAGEIPCDLPFFPQEKRTKPILETLLGLRASGTSASLVDAFKAAAPELRWNATYTAADVGEEFLEKYGWVDVIGPYGPFVWSGCRLMIGYWAEGLQYPRHWHEAEEVYAPLFGSAEFSGESYGKRIASVGDTVLHAPNEEHSAIMQDGGLLALAIWKGENVAVAPTIQSISTGKLVTAVEVRP